MEEKLVAAWEKVKAFFLHSLTLAWAALTASASAALLLGEQLSNLFATPEVKAQLGIVFSTQTVALIGLCFAVVTALTRLRSLLK